MKWKYIVIGIVVVIALAIIIITQQWINKNVEGIMFKPAVQSVSLGIEVIPAAFLILWINNRMK